MNELRKALKKKAIKVYLIWGVILLLIGVGVMAIGCADLWKYLTADSDIWSHSAAWLMEDTWYVCDNNYLLDCYMDDKDGCYYITATSDYEFLGFYVPNKYVDIADQVVDGCWEYIDDIAEDWPDIYVTGKGHVENMEYEERQYFKSWFEYAGADEDVISSLVYKTIYLDTPASVLLDDGNVIALSIGFVVFLFGVLFIVFFITDRPRNTLLKQLKESNIPEQTL